MAWGASGPKKLPEMGILDEPLFRIGLALGVPCRRWRLNSKEGNPSTSVAAIVAVAGPWVGEVVHR